MSKRSIGASETAYTVLCSPVRALKSLVRVCTPPVFFPTLRPSLLDTDLTHPVLAMNTVRAERCVTGALLGKREVAKITSVLTAVQTLPALAIVSLNSVPSQVSSSMFLAG